jgi:hypothetical protein
MVLSSNLCVGERIELMCFRLLMRWHVPVEALQGQRASLD